MRREGLFERYIIVPLGTHHNRRPFTCGVEALDSYLQRQASQDIRRNVAAVFVAEERTCGEVHGYYTLSMASLPLDRLPEPVAQRMPRYPTVPAVRLGRLAVPSESQGIGLGAHLLVYALTRSIASEVAWAACLVDAKENEARAFYLQYGFIPFQDDRHHLYLMRHTVESVLAP